MRKDAVPPRHESVTPLEFNPLPGFSSPHAQTILACFTPGGPPPPSKSRIFKLSDGDALCCEVSTPPLWQSTGKTVILIHGLGGCHTASYMVRMSRKLCQKGYRAVRVNMRNCGSGKNIAKLPYHGGLSNDVIEVLQELKRETPLSPFILVGYSLGGNIVLKLAGEIDRSDIVQHTIAVCPPIDLAETAEIMARPGNNLYNRYYMHNLDRITKKWTEGRPFNNVYEYDLIVTAPKWGFTDPAEYYKKSSSRYLLDRIHHTCHILFSEDDPFIDHYTCLNSKKSKDIKIWLSKYGGHMGFFVWSDSENGYFWLDKILLDWISNSL